MIKAIHVSSAAEPDGLAALRETAEADGRLDRMIGQTIMVGFSGQNEHDPGVKAVRDQLANGVIGEMVFLPVVVLKKIVWLRQRSFSD